MSRHIFQRQGLITADGEPGPDWGEFTKAFDREDKRAMEILGGLTAHIVLQTVELRLATAYMGRAQQFGSSAEPPILTLRESEGTGLPDDEVRVASDLASQEGWAAMAFHNTISMTIQEELAQHEPKTPVGA